MLLILIPLLYILVTGHFILSAVLIVEKRFWVLFLASALIGPLLIYIIFLGVTQFPLAHDNVFWGLFFFAGTPLLASLIVYGTIKKTLKNTFAWLSKNNLFISILGGVSTGFFISLNLLLSFGH